MEIEELQVQKLLNQKFISLVRNSEKCTNMLETILEPNAWKRKSEEHDMREREETLKLLKDKKGNFKLLFQTLKMFFLRHRVALLPF